MVVLHSIVAFRMQGWSHYRERGLFVNDHYHLNYQTDRRLLVKYAIPFQLKQNPKPKTLEINQ